MKINVKSYLAQHPYPIVFALLMAAEGDFQILAKMTGGERQAYDALKTAKRYGQETRIFSLVDYPLAISNSGGGIMKIPERLSGLVLSGQTEFFGIECNVAEYVEPPYNLDKEETERLTAFTREFLKENQDSGLK